MWADYSYTVAGNLVYLFIFLTTPTLYITAYSFTTDTEGTEVHYYKSLRRDEVDAGMSTISYYIIELLIWVELKQAVHLHFYKCVTCKRFQLQ